MVNFIRTRENEQDVVINVLIHDINKLVKDVSFTINHNDASHAVKNTLKNVSSGPTYMRDKTWSEQLDDKLEPVATHLHWAIWR